MAGQGIDRREAIRYIGLAAAASAFPGFRQWTFACPAHPEQAMLSQAVGKAYEPLFFSPQHFPMVEQLAEIIIPADGTPGAKEAGVAEFIDFMAAKRAPVVSRRELRTTQDILFAGSQTQVRFLTGLDWLNARSKSEFGDDFLKCSADRQNSLIEELAYKGKFKPDTEVGRDLFQLMRAYTVVGYYTSKIGLQSLGYPGLQTVWQKMPGCAHRDNSAHAHFPVADSIETLKIETGS